MGAEILPKMYFVFQVQCPIVTKSGPFEVHAFKVEGMIFHENPSNPQIQSKASTADREFFFIRSSARIHR